MNQSLETIAERAKAEIARHEVRIRLIGELAKLKEKYGSIFNEVLAASSKEPRHPRAITGKLHTGLTNSLREYFQQHPGPASAREVADAIGDSLPTKARDPRTSVSATLSAMADRGELERVPGTDGPLRFKAAT